ncbi:equilibrative nucleoside transporter 4 [Sinocyclocheilus rhinocerous]|uniref:equilibrative nucleoside transporter 4 n=1 Tax=Sinocyclocheilus rhinocerous TaxID=307959 RepID=UPI0007B98B5D|nr:PREDICTED: equilibrative nucleoside transporter 4 [Sinocyclocheilus rhinocerous]
MYSEEWSRNRQGREKSVITNFSFSQLPDEEKTGRIKPHSAQDSEESIPDDRYHGIYFAMLLAGVGFLLPYNSFITDVDYLHRKFTGTSIVFDMSLTYILVALSAVIVNNALVERLSLNTRICVGYLFALGPLVFVSVFDVWLELFDTQQSYALTLAAIAIVAFGCTVQQSSFYGYTGMLPKRYTQGVMTGEKLLGQRCAVARVIWTYMLSILVTYFITLCLFPGLESELRNDTLGEWLPILTMALFNMADFVGKILAVCPYEWGGVQLLVCSCLRIVFLPLFVMCVSPVQRPLLAHPAWPCSLSLMLGISNGYLGSVPMIQAAGKVPLQQREVAASPAGAPSLALRPVLDAGNQ